MCHVRYLEYQGANTHIGGSSNSPRVNLTVDKLDLTKGKLILIKLFYLFHLAWVGIPKIFSQKLAFNQ